MKTPSWKVVLAIAAAATLISLTWYFWFRPCSRLSGRHSYAWGGARQVCEMRGCRAVKVKTIEEIPGAFDTGGEVVWCVPGF